MDRLAAHVIATAALTVTLATVPVLFADASHAASSATASPLSAATSSGQAPDARNEGSDALPALPPLAPETQTQAPAPAQAPAAGPEAGTAETDQTHVFRHDRRPRFELAFAPAERPCSDRREVGAPGYEHYHGMIAFTVREYYSPACHSYFGYSFAWHRFRSLHVRYDVGMAVYDAKHDAIDGARTYVGGTGGPGYWSVPVAGAADACVLGEGHYFYYPAGAPAGFEEGDATSKRDCAAADRAGV